MKVAIDKLPPYHVAYMRWVGPYGPETIPALWQRFIQWMERRGLLAPDNLKLGIAHDSPRVVPPAQCRYDACLVVPEDFVPDEIVSVTNLPGWKVGTTELVGTAHDVRSAGDALFTQLVESGLNPGSPFIEIYRGNPEVPGQPGTFRSQLCFALS
jgi:AraC family transcriptional regulator